MQGRVVILGVFVADTSYRARRLPRLGETLIGESFALGPGGKGSNQAVAAGRAGAAVRMLARLGRDDFASMARDLWAGAGVVPVVIESDTPTGAACILIEHGTGENAIVICPGAGGEVSAADVERWGAEIDQAAVFLTQLETPVGAAHAALARARAAGAVTVLNPAPAAALPAGMLALCDYVTPNEAEAEGLTGIAVGCPETARRAAEALCAAGAGAAVITLGEKGALFHDTRKTVHIPAFDAGPVVETTGAGDAFNGGFAAALGRGAPPVDAVRHGCAAAGLAVTRAGAAASMPTASEIAALLASAG